MVAIRVLTVVVGLALGARCGIGVLVGALFERDGFGDRDGPSTANLLALAVGIVASFGLPLALRRMLSPGRFSWPAALTATVVAVAGAAWIDGDLARRVTVCSAERTAAAVPFSQDGYSAICCTRPTGVSP